jgi:hypothetical protein
MIYPWQAMINHVPHIRDLRLFDSPVFAFHHHRQAKDGTWRGLASIFLRKHGASREGYLIYGHSGKKAVVSNDITFGENFQWATANEGKLPAINRLSAGCSHDSDIRLIEDDYRSQRDRPTGAADPMHNKSPATFHDSLGELGADGAPTRTPKPEGTTQSSANLTKDEAPPPTDGDEYKVQGAGHGSPNHPPVLLRRPPRLAGRRPVHVRHCRNIP